MTLEGVLIMPIGAKLFEETGRSSSVTVKSTDGAETILEFSFDNAFKGFGRLNGVTGRNRGTVEVLLADSGVRTGEGHGVLVTKTGDKVAWHRHGFNTMKGSSPVYVAGLTFKTASKTLAWLNDAIAIVEGEIDPDLEQITRTGYLWEF